MSQITYADGTALDLTQGLTFTWRASGTGLALSGSNDGANVFELAPGGDVVTGSGQTANTYVFGKGDGHGILNYVIIPILLHKAGLPEADSRGTITSHRARATLATKLYNGASGLGPLEVMSWLGHTHFSSTQHYLALTPVRLMTAFHKGAKLTENLRMVGVLVDSRPEPGQPVFRYNLGHGWCTVSGAPRPWSWRRDGQLLLAAAQHQGISSSMRACGQPFTRRVNRSAK